MKILVRSKNPRFRRAGFEFTSLERRVLDTEDLTVEQLAAIETESMLVVEHIKEIDLGISDPGHNHNVMDPGHNHAPAPAQTEDKPTAKKKPKG